MPVDVRPEGDALLPAKSRPNVDGKRMRAIWRGGPGQRRMKMKSLALQLAIVIFMCILHLLARTLLFRACSTYNFGSPRSPAITRCDTAS